MWLAASGILPGQVAAKVPATGPGLTVSHLRETLKHDHAPLAGGLRPTSTSRWLRARRRGGFARPPVRWHSVSSTREYELCPRRYRYAYVERLPQDRHVPIPWRIGSAVHAALERPTASSRGRRPAHSKLPSPRPWLRCTTAGRHSSCLTTDRYRRAARYIVSTLRDDVLLVGEVVGVELPLRDDLSPGIGSQVSSISCSSVTRSTMEIVDHKVTLGERVQPTWRGLPAQPLRRSWSGLAGQQ
jgi:hypothetical protein